MNTVIKLKSSKQTLIVLFIRLKLKIFYENFWKNKEISNFSYYPKYLKYYNNANNLVLVKVKDISNNVARKGLLAMVRNILKDGCSRLSHFHKCNCEPYINIFAKYRQFILVFSLVRTATLFTIFSKL